MIGGRWAVVSLDRPQGAVIDDPILTLPRRRLDAREETVARLDELLSLELVV